MEEKKGQTLYYERRVAELETLKPGQMVRFKATGLKRWSK